MIGLIPSLVLKHQVLRSFWTFFQSAVSNSFSQKVLSV